MLGLNMFKHLWVLISKSLSKNSKFFYTDIIHSNVKLSRSGLQKDLEGSFRRIWHSHRIEFDMPLIGECNTFF